MSKFDNSPNMLSTIKNLDNDALSELATELRKELIEDVSKTGGHLASNLGIVELTLALHKVFDLPKDKLVFDVGHQSYIHKMLTGRLSEMSTIRQMGGISGFPKREESIYDMSNPGHSGTSISIAYGYAKARDLAGEDYNCIAVIGDGAMTGGVAYEALNDAGASKTPLIVILNDNEMSISKNVGGISKHLQKLRTSDLYNNFKSNLKQASESSPRFRKGLENIRNSIKYNFVPGAVFEELGFKYYGPIDGHNISDLVNALEFVKKLNRPVLLHVITKKGKGFLPAEQNPSKYHGVGPFDINSANSKTIRNKQSWSETFGSAFSDLADIHEDVVAVSAAMIDSTGLKEYKVLHPERVFDAGIAEQHAVAFAEGLALNGYRPIVAIYSTFLQRAYDQILIEVCLQNLPVVFAIDRAGLTGSDGETHQGLFDIAFLSSMPNMTILSPRDAKSLRSMLNYAYHIQTPVAIRYPKGNVPGEDIFGIDCEDVFIPIPQMLRYGEDALIISDGINLINAIKASDILRESGFKVAVCDLRVLKPLDSNFIIEAFKKYPAIITIEDGVIKGGFGESISAMAALKSDNPKVLNLGWPDNFIEHGSTKDLRKKYGLDEESIAIKVSDFIEAKA